MTQDNLPRPENTAWAHDECVCGEPATTTVEVQWVDRKRRYRYCDECADDVVFAIEGAEVLP